MAKQSIEWAGGEAHFGETFDRSAIEYTDRSDSAWAQVLCYANGSTVTGVAPGSDGLVFSDQVNLGDTGLPDHSVTFGPSQIWQGGGATCHLVLLSERNGEHRPSAESDDFEVLP